jgi:hypothetical protein
MLQKCMQRVIHDDLCLPVKFVSRTNKDILPFVDLFVGALSLIRSHINEFCVSGFRDEAYLLTHLVRRESDLRYGLSASCQNFVRFRR